MIIMHFCALKRFVIITYTYRIILFPGSAIINIGNAVATVKRTLSNTRDGDRNCYACEAITHSERFIGNARNRVRDRIACSFVSYGVLNEFCFVFIK